MLRKSVWKGSTALAFVVGVAIFAGRRIATADCGFEVTVKNTGDLPFTVGEIKTAAAGGVYKSQWSGLQKIAPGKTHKFKFTVNSKCGANHDVKFVMEDGDVCKKIWVDSGATVTITKKNDCS